MQLSSFYQKHHHYQLYIDFFDELSHNQLCQLLSKQSSLFLEGLMNHKIAKAFQKYQYLSIDQLVIIIEALSIRNQRNQRSFLCPSYERRSIFKGSNRRFGIETISMYLCNGRNFECCRNVWGL